MTLTLFHRTKFLDHFNDLQSGQIKQDTSALSQGYFIHKTVKVFNWFFEQEALE